MGGSDVRMGSFPFEHRVVSVWCQDLRHRRGQSPSFVDFIELRFVLQDRGHVKLYQIPIPVDATSSSKPRDGVTPEQLTSKHSVTSFSPLSNDKVLLTINSLTSPNTLSVLDLSATKDRLTPLASLTPDLKEKYGLDSGSEFTFAGAEGKEVHGWAVLPPDYDESRTYPLAFLVHGGPQGAWNDSWSTRWNPNAFAAAGYITIAINPTGSTGYGQEFCDAIKNHWGGRPFQDLVAGLEYVKKRFPIDEKRMAALGASYGGYMTNWIQVGAYLRSFRKAADKLRRVTTTSPSSLLSSVTMVVSTSSLSSLLRR